MRILWLKTELLHPVDKGGKIRTFQMLKELKKEHKVTYLTLDDGSADPEAAEKAREYCDDVVTVPHRVAGKFSGKFYVELAANAASHLPYALQKYVSAQMRRAIEVAIRKSEYDVIVCDFLAPAVNVPEGISIPSVLFQHNVEAMIWRRHYEVARSPLKRAFFKLQWQRMAEFERNACQRFDRVVAVSKEDAETMQREYCADSVGDVPTGVDTEYFSSARGSLNARNSIVFTGSMDWLPNEDAITWFAGKVWPIIRRSVEDATLVAVGRNPSPSLIELAGRDESITVTGRVPDVRPYMTDAGVFIVPIRVGGGTRLKIFEAMAMGLPVVSTTIGAEGLPVRDGDEILLRDEPHEFAKAVIQLLRDPELSQSIGQRAADTVRARFSWSSATAEFARQCQLAIESAKNKSPQALGKPVSAFVAGA